MSLIAAAQWTAVATIVLAVFAIVTAVFAFLAFRAQSSEVTTLRGQLEDQKELNPKQTPVLELQARELRESIDERKRDAEDQRQSQANKVAAWFGLKDFGPVQFSSGPRGPSLQLWGAFIRNDSGSGC